MENKSFQVMQSGERTNTLGKPVSNIILLSISDGEYSSLRPHLEYVELPNHLVLHEAGAKLEFVYFPNRGLHGTSGSGWTEQEPAAGSGANHW